MTAPAGPGWPTPGQERLVGVNIRHRLNREEFHRFDQELANVMRWDARQIVDATAGARLLLNFSIRGRRWPE